MYVHNSSVQDQQFPFLMRARGEVGAVDFEAGHDQFVKCVAKIRPEH